MSPASVSRYGLSFDLGVGGTTSTTTTTAFFALATSCFLSLSTTRRAVGHARPLTTWNLGTHLALNGFAVRRSTAARCEEDGEDDQETRRAHDVRSNSNEERGKRFVSNRITLAWAD